MTETTLEQVKETAAAHGLVPDGFLNAKPADWPVKDWDEDCVAQIEHCRCWIREKGKALRNCHRIWSKHDSYRYKHDVERWANCYIYQGSFILAAILEGLQYSQLVLNVTQDQQIVHSLRAVFRDPHAPLSKEGERQVNRAIKKMWRNGPQIVFGLGQKAITLKEPTLYDN